MYTIGLWCACTTVGQAAMNATINTVSLRSSVMVSDLTSVTLADVAVVEGAEAQQLSELRVGVESGAVRQAEVVKVLEGAGFHRAQVMVKGFVVCRVELSNTLAKVSNEKVIIKTLPSDATQVSGDSRTLRDQVMTFVATLAKVPVTELRIEFAAGDAKLLDEPVGETRLEIEAGGSGGTGRVPMVLRRYRGDTLIETRRVTAEVTRRYQAVALTRSLSKGEVIGSNDVTMREVYVTGSVQPVRDVQQAVGMMLRGLAREGSVLMSDQLQPARIVQRGQLITVRSLAGNVSVTMTARALDEAGVGEVIAVRNEKSRQTFSARITLEGQGVLVSDSANSASEEGR